MRECTHHWTVTSPCPYCQGEVIDALRAVLAIEVGLKFEALAELDKARAALAKAHEALDAWQKLDMNQNYNTAAAFYWKARELADEARAAREGLDS